jgi:chromosome segregation ATPase
LQEYDGTQGDDTSCFITGSCSATIFLPHQLPRATALLAAAEEEDVAAVPKTRSLKDDEEDLR